MRWANHIRVAGLLCAGSWLLPLAVHAAHVYGVVDIPPTVERRAKQRYAGAAAEVPDPPPAPRAIVYLEALAQSTAAAAGRTAPRHVIRQQGLQFVPGLLPVRVGDSVQFPNLDRVYHNVFSYSPAKKFDLGRFQGEVGAPEVLFDTPGVVRVFCEIHPHMRATVLIVETPWFCLTDEQGNFELADVPPGRYRAVAWFDDNRTLEHVLEIAADTDRQLLTFTHQ
jgi:plastocyanin